MYSTYADVDEAKATVDQWLYDLKAHLKASEIVIALSDRKHNFRKDILPTYKENRATIKPPMLRRVLEDYLIETYPVKQKTELEADDVLGILATDTKLYSNFSKVIVTLDKDLRTIPCKYYNWKQKERGIQDVSITEADRYHLIQTLTGDVVDGYVGCPGIGKVRAQRLLEAWDGQDIMEAWGIVIKAYKKAGIGEDEALTQARVARILRTTDYDYKQQTPILWEPMP